MTCSCSWCQWGIQGEEGSDAMPEVIAIEKESAIRPAAMPVAVIRGNVHVDVGMV